MRKNFIIKVVFIGLALSIITSTIYVLIPSGSEDEGITFIETYGSSSHEYGGAVQQTNDGGYIIAGGIDGPSFGYDVLLIKTDQNGNEIWSRTFGGNDTDGAWSVGQTLDGGYIIGGFTRSYGAGEMDALIIKTDKNGDMLWKRTFGGFERDYCHSVEQTIDGGYIITGDSTSYAAFGSDVWLIKIDGNGNEEWNKTFGGRNWDGEGKSVMQTSDGGYIIAGCFENDTDRGSLLLMKTDHNGNEIWNRTYIGDSESRYRTKFGDSLDIGYYAQQTTDGGYIITGAIRSYRGSQGEVWLIKTDGNGSEVWKRTYKKGYWDSCRAVKQTIDGGYVIMGTHTNGEGDIWLLKVDSEGYLHDNEEKTDTPIMIVIICLVFITVVLAIVTYLRRIRNRNKKS